MLQLEVLQFAMSTYPFGFSCQTIAGTVGINSQRVYVTSQMLLTADGHNSNSLQVLLM